MGFPDIFSPQEIPARFVRGWNNRNVDELVSIFAEEAEFVNVVGLWWHNKAQIRKAHDYGLRVIFSNSELQLQKSTVKSLTTDVAVVHAKMRLSNQNPTGKIREPQLRHNVFTFVVQRFGEKWLCVAAHNTDIVPGAETNIMDGDGTFSSVSYRQ